MSKRTTRKNKYYASRLTPDASLITGRAIPEKSEINYRSAVLNLRADNGPASIDEKTRSVDIVLSTEAPARVYSWDRGVIDEILLMSGAQIPGNKQLVMLDTHSRWDTSDIIGSARDVRIEGDRMIGRAFFSSAPEAEAPWTKVREGHLTDFSVGYRVDEAVWIPENQTATIEGRTYQGPLQVAVKWTPREISAVPIGADQNAKARAEINQPLNKEDEKMNPQVRAMLESKGLPATATDEEAIAFLAKLEVKNETSTETEAERAEKEEKIRKEATGRERDRIREIDSLCAKYDCADMARQLIIDGVDLIDAQRKVLDAIQERSRKHNPGSGSVVVLADAKDKFRAAAEHGLILRGGLSVDKPAPGADELRGFTLVEIARECLRVSNLPYRDNIKQMVGRALTSSDFPYILANIANKFLQTGWDTVEETWPIWTGEGSVNDFKIHTDNALSEFDDLEEIPDSGEIKQGSFSEKAPETYKAVSHGKKFKVTRVMIINDDMGAFTTMPAKRSESASRKIGDIVYAIITANGNMGDGHAIFDNTYHANDAASGYRGVPGIDSLNEAERAMGTHKDIKGLRRLNIRPVFFLAPLALKGRSELFFKSEKYSDSNTVATDSSLASTRANVWSGDILKRIYEPRLDDDSLTAWYLLARKGMTVKVVFLNGQKSPILEMNQPGFSVEGFEYAVVIDVGAYATRSEGMYRNEGA